jgi:lipoprotein-anchoring transpeptidase ErfK/SrfK
VQPAQPGDKIAVSHGCVRLQPAKAAVLYGLRATTVVVQ